MDDLITIIISFLTGVFIMGAIASAGAFWKANPNRGIKRIKTIQERINYYENKLEQYKKQLEVK